MVLCSFANNRGTDLLSYTATVTIRMRFLSGLISIGRSVCDSNSSAPV